MQCMYMFEKATQRRAFAIGTLFAIVVYGLYYFVGPDDELPLVTAELTRNRVVNALLVTILIQALSFYYASLSNQIFEEVKNYSDRIDQEAKEKETFIACVSHEIRNPIQALMGSLELLFPDIAKNSESKRLLEICKSACEVVLNLVNNILEISKIHANKMDLCVSPCDPRETVLKVVRLCKQKADGKELYLNFVECESMPPALELDSHKLSQVVLNMVSNAIKFTQKGGVTVSMFWTPFTSTSEFSTSLEESIPEEEPLHNELFTIYKREIRGSIMKAKTFTRVRSRMYLSSPSTSRRIMGCRKGIAKITIEDTGIGIREESISNLFKPFNQADPTICKHYGGTGLGLWISKNILDLMGGTIKVESRVGVGSKFTIEFPAKVCDERELLVDPSEMVNAFSALQGKRCLVLDDIADNTYLVKHVLENHGVRTITQNRGENALEIFKVNRTLDAIITDLRMPGISGQTFIMEVRKIEVAENRKPVPIIVVTAESDLEERMNCLSKYGANDYLVKPVKLSELLHSLFKLVTAPIEKPAKNVLIVEDDTMSAFFLARVISQQGHSTVICNTIAKAKSKLLEVARGNKIDVILLDSTLPDGTGRDLLEFIANNASVRLPNSPTVISMSGNAPTDQMTLYTGYDVAGFLQKPLSKSQILALIQ